MSTVVGGGGGPPPPPPPTVSTLPGFLDKSKLNCCSLLTNKLLWNISFKIMEFECSCGSCSRHLCITHSNNNVVLPLRLQTGMRGAFGKPQGTVARVHIGQTIMSVRCKDTHKEKAVEALRRAKFKYPGRQKVCGHNRKHVIAVLWEVEFLQKVDSIYSGVTGSR